MRRGTLSGIKGGEYFFDIRNTFFNSTGVKYWEAFLGYQNIKIHDIFMAAAKRTKNSFKRGWGILIIYRNISKTLILMLKEISIEKS